MNAMHHESRLRSGIAAVEFALVLPVIALLLLGALEAARAVMVTHALQEAAQAGCRVYCVEDTTAAQAKAIVQLAMTRAGLSNVTIALDPPTKSQIDVSLEPVSVTVTTSYTDVAWLPASYLSGAVLSGVCVMPADLDHSDGGDQDGYHSLDDDHDADGHMRHNEPKPGGDDDDDD